jgi:hypothetical protein
MGGSHKREEVEVQEEKLVAVYCFVWWTPPTAQNLFGTLRTHETDAIVSIDKISAIMGRSMPLVVQTKGYRLFFYSNEGDPREPLHVHIRKAASIAKYWIEPEIELAESYGFKKHELTEIQALVCEHQDLIQDKWHEFFGD